MSTRMQRLSIRRMETKAIKEEEERMKKEEEEAASNNKISYERSSDTDHDQNDHE